MKKRQEELAQVTAMQISTSFSRFFSRIIPLILYPLNSLQEKAANAMVLASDTIRWTMGPSGTTVTFPSEVGLPSLFDHKPSRYQSMFVP